MMKNYLKKVFAVFGRHFYLSDDDVVNNIEPAEDSMDDCPENGLMETP